MFKQKKDRQFEFKTILENRKRLYTEESKQYFNGNIYVPDDLDVIEL